MNMDIKLLAVGMNNSFGITGKGEVVSWRNEDNAQISDRRTFKVSLNQKDDDSKNILGKIVGKGADVVSFIKGAVNQDAIEQKRRIANGIYSNLQGDVCIITTQDVRRPFHSLCI